MEPVEVERVGERERKERRKGGERIDGRGEGRRGKGRGEKREGTGVRGEGRENFSLPRLQDAGLSLPKTLLFPLQPAPTIEILLPDKGQLKY